jgi:hypothetical protein
MPREEARESMQEFIDRIEDLVMQPEPDADALYDLAEEIIGSEFPPGRVRRGRMLEVRQANRLELLQHLEGALRVRAGKEKDDVLRELLQEQADKVREASQDVQQVMEKARDIPPNPLIEEVRNTWNRAADLFRKKKKHG